MKLVVATPLYPPEIGGPATYAKLLEAGLPGEGIEVTLVKFGEVRHLPKIIRHVAYFLRVRRALRRADLVLALDPVSTGLPACLAAWTLGKPLVVKVVGDYAWEQGRQRAGITASLDEFVRETRVPFLVRFLRRVETGVARYAVRVITPSRYLKGIVAAWGIPSGKVEVVYNAVPAGEAGTVPEKVARLPHPLIVTVGRLVPWKHIDGVIDAAAKIPDASLVVVGEGPERAALVTRAANGRVCFTGALPHEDLLATMRAADVLVLNSSYEGLSHLLIEAQTLGMPIVATAIGGNPEVVTDGESGLLVPFGDQAALVQALARVLSDAALQDTLRAGAQRSAARFSQSAMLKRTAETLRASALP